MSKPLAIKPAITRTGGVKDNEIGQMTKSQLKAFIIDILRHQTHEVSSIVATEITTKRLTVTESIDTP